MEWHLAREFEVLLAKSQIEGLLQNLDILFDILVRHGGLRRLDLRQRGLEFMPRGDFIRARGIRDEIVEFRQPLRRTLFGRVLKLHAQQHVGVFVALLDPAFFGLIAAG